jgi:predicted DNA-binding transcriptional regulator YafY
VKFRAGGAREMAWHLYTWGDEVEVIEPADFWELARKTASRAEARGAPRRDGDKDAVMYRQVETILRIALDMQGTAKGLSLDDIRRNYADEPLSRETALRLRDAVEQVFPKMFEVKEGRRPKRWRIPDGTISGLISASATELADLAAGVALLRQEGLLVQAEGAEQAISKLRALMKATVQAGAAVDLPAWTQAEGIAMRPGPRRNADPAVVAALRQAILTNHSVRFDYTYRGNGSRGAETVDPYGFLYGNRHYLVAWSHWAEDFRSYALSNIRGVVPLDAFERQAAFRLKDYTERSFGVFQEPPFDVIWKFSPRAAPDARAFLFHPTQKLREQPDGSLLVSFRAGGAREMAWHLHTWGDEVEVIEPVDFWQRVKK